MRLPALLATLALTAVLGFAPAPFPKRERALNRDDLETMQGTWKMTSYDSGGRPIGHNYKCRIKNNRWIFISLDAREAETGNYVFNLDTKVSPRAFEWKQSDTPDSGGWVGSYKLEGGRKLTLVFGSGTLKTGIENRPRDFNGTPSYRMTLDFMER